MHFSVLVIGESIDSKLEPYDEDLGETQLIETYDELLEVYKGKIDMNNPVGWLRENHKMDDDCFIDTNGSCKLYLPNPIARYDWYKVGGRWDNVIQLKDGVQVPPNPNKSAPEYSIRLAILGRTYTAKVKDIFDIDTDKIHSVIDEYGDWHDSEDINLPSLIEQKLLKLDPEEIITIVDCHI